MRILRMGHRQDADATTLTKAAALGSFFVRQPVRLPYSFGKHELHTYSSQSRRLRKMEASL
jgi:hypothetical protein